MAYVHIDVDLNEFDTDELIEELIGRFNSGRKKRLNQAQTNELKESALMLLSSLGGVRQ